MKIVKQIIVYILMLPIWIYKYVISPWTPASCRHTPSCSQYAIDALKIHGPFKGFYLATHRFLRCNPWGTSGYDPVPKIIVKKFKPNQKSNIQ